MFLTKKKLYSQHFIIIIYLCGLMTIHYLVLLNTVLSKRRKAYLQTTLLNFSGHSGVFPRPLGISLLLCNSHVMSNDTRVLWIQFRIEQRQKTKNKSYYPFSIIGHHSNHLECSAVHECDVLTVLQEVMEQKSLP